MIRLLYSLLTYLLLPVVLLRFAYRSRRYQLCWKHGLQRLGYIQRVKQNPCLWVHAVSVGETIAAQALINSLCQYYPDHTIFITHMTSSGFEHSKHLFSKLDQVSIAYVPYDTPGAMKRFLRRIHPRIAIMMETEWWPNCFHYCSKFHIPLLIANGRLSARSQRRYSHISWITRHLMQQVTCYAAQSEADAQRVLALGLPPDRMNIVGNLKIDVNIDEQWKIDGDKLRQQLGKHRPVWVAASTHAGEETILLAAHHRVCRVLPNAVLILVPRHPNRFNVVAELAQHSGLNIVRRTDQKTTLHDNQSLFLGNTLGEMMIFYAAADVAFVGGSLVPIGGHNLLEPARLKLPILSGSHLHNFMAISQLLLDAQALTIVDEESLAEQVIQWLKYPEERKQVGARAERALHAHHGALERHLALIKSLVTNLQE